MAYHTSIVKWPGGKLRHLDHIIPCLRPGPNRHLIEGFAGSMALSNNMWPQYATVTVGDANKDVINLYQCVIAGGSPFSYYLSLYFSPAGNTHEQYYERREAFNRWRKKENGTVTREAAAGLFLYLNRHGYNGLVRYSLEGVYNVPFGTYKKPAFPQEAIDRLSVWSKKRGDQLQIYCADFEQLLAQAGPETDAYLDPPYLTDGGGFVAYTKYGFSAKEHRRLAQAAVKARGRGARVLVSNRALPLAFDIYSDANDYVTYQAGRPIAQSVDGRQSVEKVLFIYE